MRTQTFPSRILVLSIFLMGTGGPVAAATLVEAVATNDVSAVRELLKEQPDRARAKDAEGFTPLHFAAFLGHDRIARLLIDSGAEVNAVTEDGTAPLHGAAARGHLAVVKLLVEHRANVNAKTKEGATPLLLATREDHQEVIRFLREKGATYSGVTRTEEVGELGDPMRLVFAGNRTFTTEQLRQGLLSDTTFLLAAHPFASRGDLLGTVSNRLRDGYLFGGFPQVQVRVATEGLPERIRVQIEEGRRYRAGAVRIQGGETVPKDRLMRRLIQPRWEIESKKTETSIPVGPGGKAEAVGELGLSMTTWANLPEPPHFLDSAGREVERRDPIWDQGQWARFGENPRRGFQAAITNTLQELGYYGSRVDVSVVPRAEEAVADLVVQLLEEGAQGTIEAIDIQGNQRHSRQAILDLLELKPGLPLTRDRIYGLEYRLWDSGRFLSYELLPEPLPGSPNRFQLSVKLEECEEITPLGQPLSRDESAFLKLREWLLRLPTRSDDVVVSVKARLGPLPEVQGVTMILGSNGWALSLSTTNRGEAGLPRYALVLNGTSFAFYSPAWQRQWVASGIRQEIVGTISLLPNRNEKEGKDYSLNIGGTFKGVPEDEADFVPFTLKLFLAPVAFVNLAHRYEGLLRWNDRVLQVAEEGWHMRFEEETGRLLELALAEPGDNFEATLRFERGALARLQDALEQAARTHRNYYDPQRPVTAPVSFLSGELLRSPWASYVWSGLSPDQRERAAAVLETVLGQGVLHPLDTALPSKPEAAEESFFIPQDRFEDGSSALGMVVSAMAAFLFQASRDLFPARSWPWTLLRESVYVLGGNDQYTRFELDRLYRSEETGPIGCLATAQLLSLAGSPAAKTFAERGLERLSAARFQSDYRLLLEGETVWTECLRRLGRALCALDAQEVEALAALCAAENRDLFRSTIARWRKSPDQPMLQVLAPALDAYWKKSLRRDVQGGLRTLSEADRSPKAGR